MALYWRFIPYTNFAKDKLKTSLLGFCTIYLIEGLLQTTKKISSYKREPHTKFVRKCTFMFFDFSKITPRTVLVRLKFGHFEKIQACSDRSRPTEIIFLYLN
jgi:hypothetical protein